MSAAAKPAVLFVCVKNGGKSQMAAGIMNARAGARIEVSSAGTHPGSKINALSSEVLLEQGIDITAEHPKQLTEAQMRQAGLVVVLGREAQVPQADGGGYRNLGTRGAKLPRHRRTRTDAARARRDQQPRRRPGHPAAVLSSEYAITPLEKEFL